MAVSRKSVTPSQQVPQSIAEVEAILGRIGELTATLKENAAAVEAHIAILREREVAQRAPLDAEVARLETQVRDYCNAHRAELTNGGRSKSVRLATGTVSWRKGRMRVRLSSAEDDVLTALRAAKLTRFIRVVEEVDKAEMLRQPAQAARVPGVEIIEASETITIETNG
ncbi:MAG: host-nuclease inhibitor Gam family protein [Hyphomicrobiaceae bacterium]|nr:host-nuclease inhibitor Gam family protein [Hyphomicrobiaceae bacterium]